MAIRESLRATGFVRCAAAVMRHEVRLAFHSPMSYVLALGFVLSVNMAIFAVGEFLSTNEASVRLFTLFLPWVAIVFVPALAMRAWSAGHDDRGLEFAMSLPITDGALVTGKFLAGLVIFALVLLLAAVFPATVHYLGEPDLGATAGAWLAAFALLAAFYAVALGAAATTVDATAAFVVADVDWIFDPFSVDVVDAAGRTLTRPINDNHAFLANMVAFGSGAAPLAEIRSRRQLRRPFTRIEQLFREGEADTRDELSKLARKISEGERHIEKLIAASGASSPERLRGEISTTVTEIRRHLLPLRHREREIRAQIRAGVDALQAQVIAVNFAVPVVLVAVLAGIIAWRRRRTRGA